MTPTAHNHPERGERSHLQNYAPDARRNIERAAEIQADLAARQVGGEAWGDGAFTKGSTVSGTVWHRLKRGEYVSKRVPQITRAILDHAMRLERRARGSGKAVAGVAGFIETDAYRALARSLEVCGQLGREGKEDRLLVVVGRPGMGKTTLARQTLADLLRAEKPRAAWHLHAMPSWGRSYHAFLATLAREIGLPEGASSSKLEATLLRELGSREEPVLLVEEVEDVGPLALSFFKALLNQTGSTIVLFMTPEFQSALGRSPRGQARQLLRRQAALIPLGDVDAALVKQMDPGLWPQAEPETLRLVVADANLAGGLDYVSRVMAFARKAVAKSPQRVPEAIAEARRAALRQLAA